MSDSEDSELAEWEQEQMARGTQSRPKCNQINKPSSATIGTTKSEFCDATALKSNIQDDIERAKGKMETIKRSIGGTKLEIAKSDKKLAAIKERIKNLESANEEIKSNTPID